MNSCNEHICKRKIIFYIPRFIFLTMLFMHCIFNLIVSNSAPDRDLTVRVRFFLSTTSQLSPRCELVWLTYETDLLVHPPPLLPPPPWMTYIAGPPKKLCYYSALQ